MMNKYAFVICLLGATILQASSSAEHTPGDVFLDDIKSTRSLIEFLKVHRAENHLKTLTFKQETIRYDESGKVRDTTIWLESVHYPGNFRIDFGDPANGNTNIYTRDSSFAFRKHELVRTTVGPVDFMLMKGAYLHYATDSTLSRLRRMQIDPDVFTKSTYEGRPIYIIGAAENDLSVPQIWMDREHFYLCRRFSYLKSGALLDVRYDSFQQYDGHWIENFVDFYKDGKRIQTERYFDIQTNPSISPDVFNPRRFNVDMADRRGILENFEEQRRCWNKGDLVCYMKAYEHSDSIMTVSRRGVTLGYDNILKKYQQGFPVDKMGQLHFDEFRFKKLSDEYYYVVGRFNLRYEGREKLLQGWFSVLMQKIDGKWLLISDHSS